ncbi:MAG: 30S ribosomal protein S20 [Nitrospinae bacterium]|nr:30S ribosomal protein S20 [Nitrospinota bacterium]
MAKRHKSAMKRMREDQKRRVRNTSIKSALKTYAKRVEVLVEHKDGIQAAALLRKAVSAFDKAAGKGVIHRNKAARKKAVLSRKVHLLQASG